MAVESEVQPAPTRRNFIVWAMTGLLGAFGAMIAIPILPYVWPAPRKGQKSEDIAVTLQQSLASLKKGDAVEFEAPKGKAFILQTGGGNIANTGAADLAASYPSANNAWTVTYNSFQNVSAGTITAYAVCVNP